MKRNNEYDFYLEVQKLWNIEKMLVPAMTDMVEKANNEGLKNILAFHLAETWQHKTALEGILKQFNFIPEENPDNDLQNILMDGYKALANTSVDKTDDLVIENAKRIEEYEMRAYASAGQLAKELSYEGIAQRLFLTQAEEIQANYKLNFLKDRVIHNELVIQKIY